MVWLSEFKREDGKEIYRFTDGRCVEFEVEGCRTVVTDSDGNILWQGNLDRDSDLVEFRRKYEDIIKTIYMQFENPEATAFRKAVGRVVKSFVAMLLKGCDCGGEAS